MPLDNYIERNRIWAKTHLGSSFKKPNSLREAAILNKNIKNCVERLPGAGAIKGGDSTEEVDCIIDQIRFSVVLDEGNEDCFTARNIIFFDAMEEAFDCVESTTACELVDKGRVGGVVVTETHVFVFDEQAKSGIWVIDFFELGEEREGFARFWRGFTWVFGILVGSFWFLI